MATGTVNTTNKIAVWCVTEKGCSLGRQLTKELSGCHLFAPVSKIAKTSVEIPFDRLAPAVTVNFRNYSAHIFIMATGIVVRIIAPLLKTKMEDPAILVMDEAARHVISLVSGHLGGANALTEKVAANTGADPVITTATDIAGITSFDTLARRLKAKVEPKVGIKKTATALLEGRPVALICDEAVYKAVQREFPAVTHFKTIDPDALKSFEALCIISDATPALPDSLKDMALFLRPPTLALGIGCNRGTEEEEITNAIHHVLTTYRLSPLSIASIASVDLKADEEGIIKAAETLRIPFQTFPPSELNRVSETTVGLSPDSSQAMKHIGVKGVAEPAALLAAGKGADLIIPKQKIGNVTVAVARKPLTNLISRKGRLSIVSIGPGGPDYITLHARKLLNRANTVVGYTKYIELIKPFTTGKEIIQTGMTREIERVEAAIDAASKGKNVALVASGDAGVYGLAGLALELASKKEADIEMEISPGITAAVSAAAIVGAPLTNDYITLSLSDLLTPTETVISRIHTAAVSGMVTVIYNPKSRKRTRLIALLQETFLRYRAPETPVAIVTHALRKGQHTVLTTLKDFLTVEITMNSIVIIGNAETVIISSPDGPRMVTRRGYERKTKSTKL